MECSRLASEVWVASERLEWRVPELTRSKAVTGGLSRRFAPRASETLAVRQEDWTLY